MTCAFTPSTGSSFASPGVASFPTFPPADRWSPAGGAGIGGQRGAGLRGHPNQTHPGAAGPGTHRPPRAAPTVAGPEGSIPAGPSLSASHPGCLRAGHHPQSGGAVFWLIASFWIEFNYRNWHGEIAARFDFTCLVCSAAKL